MISFFSAHQNSESKCVINDFRRQEMLLKRLRTMFRRCLNRSGKSAPTIGLSAYKSEYILVENTLKNNKTIFDDQISRFHY